MRSFLKFFLPILCILVGLGLLSYPWISEKVFENRADSLISTYNDTVEEIDTTEKDALFEKAREYNQELSKSKVTLTDPFAEVDDEEGNAMDYYSVLSLNDQGMMGTIDIPKISVMLPIYHGTSASVLESGIGHMQGTSVPIGGETTHAVLTGHTGLNSAKLFTDLTKMEEGDLFFIHVLDETLAYKVCDIQVVEPSDVSSLGIQDGRDLVTLVTCTPYGVNSHRLFVTGERTEYTEEVYDDNVNEAESTPQESLWMESYKKAMLIGLGVTVALGVIAFIIVKITNKVKKTVKQHRDNYY